MLSAMPQEEQQPTSLLELPDPLLLAVMQYLAAAGDYRSLFSAARAHSRLNHAAVAALSSITVEVTQEQLDSVLLYLGKHGQHVSSLELTGCMGIAPSLCQLPSTLQLHSLELVHLRVLPGCSWQGVLGYAGVSALKQLRLISCVPVEDEDELVAALAQLAPGLEHLSIDVGTVGSLYNPMTFPLEPLQQQLTRLELAGVPLREPASPARQPPQAWSRLANLRLVAADGGTAWGPPAGHTASVLSVLTAGMLSGAANLTRLEVQGFGLEPAALAGLPQLQHLQLSILETTEDEAWTAQLLSQLQSLQQLTFLQFPCLCDAAPPAAYAALTASSRLQHLNLNDCTLPAGVWQHVFPAGRQLPHLTSLEAAQARQAANIFIAVPEASRLVSCCSGLRHLDVRGLRYSAGAFSPLRGLTGLHTLPCSSLSGEEALWEVCQLTGLRELIAYAPAAEDGLLLHMTTLRQLTQLQYYGPLDGNILELWLRTQDPGGEPVWRVLQRHPTHSDPAVAQQAAAALAVK